jgi:hypothetical protein
MEEEEEEEEVFIMILKSAYFIATIRQKTLQGTIIDLKWY